jgi:hypothetical protein
LEACRGQFQGNDYGLGVTGCSGVHPTLEGAQHDNVAVGTYLRTGVHIGQHHHISCVFQGFSGTERGLDE